MIPGKWWRLTATGLALIGHLALLQSCRVMSQYDLDRTAFKNEDARPFYQPSKEASVGRLSYAQKWPDGSLQGVCQPFRDDQFSFDWIGDVPDDAVTDSIEIQSSTWFDTDSHQLREEGKESLKKVIDRLDSYAEVHGLVIRGHTDSIASDAYNIGLGKRRAQAVHDWIRPDLGDYPVEIEPVGERQPVADNDTAEGRQANRRVEIKIVATPMQQIRSRLVGCYYSSEANIPENERAIDRRLDRRQSAKMLESLMDVPLSRGDMVRLQIPNSDEFSGFYQVGLDGKLNIPLAGKVRASGKRLSEVQAAVGQLMLDRQLLRADLLAVQLNIQKMSTASVFVNGAVFNPGRVTLNKKASSENVEAGLMVTGDFSRERMLSYALFSAGGVRPDADLENILLKRNDQQYVLDMSGMVAGEIAEDVILVEGDFVVVPTSRYFQPELVRPSQITPPGVRVMMSNLTTPASSNSLSAINSESTSLPYGTRMLIALISANCVGGSIQTNAARRAVLVSTNPATGITEVVERSVTQLVSDPDRDDINPFLMPNDGVACYDSGVTNFRDVTRVLNEFLSPISEIKSILE